MLIIHFPDKPVVFAHLLVPWFLLLQLSPSQHVVLKDLLLVLCRH